MRKIIVLLLIIVIVGQMVNLTYGKGIAGVENKVVNIEQNTIAATVHIISGKEDGEEGFQGQSTGSGVIINSEGLVLTNYHVVFPNGDKDVEIWAGLVDTRNGYLPPSQVVKLKVIQADKDLDLALLQIVPKQDSKKKKYPYLSLVSDPELTYGDTLTLVGFPSAGGLTTTVVKTNIIGFDEEEGWIKVEGSVMRGASGGAVVNKRGELVGIATKVAADRSPLFDEDGLPLGTVLLGTVGFVRSADTIATFINTNGGNGIGNETGSITSKVKDKKIKVKGTVLDKKTNKPIPGTVVAVLAAGLSGKEELVQGELLAWARTDFNGNFILNRPLKINKYRVKIVHPQYKVLLDDMDLKESNDFEIMLTREKE